MLVRNKTKKKGKTLMVRTVEKQENKKKKTLNINLQLTLDKTRDENVQRKPNITLKSYFVIIYNDNDPTEKRKFLHYCSQKTQVILFYRTIQEVIKLRRKFPKT